MALKISKQQNQSLERGASDKEIGLRAHAARRWMEAVAHLKLALEQDPSDMSVANALALSQNALGDGKAARTTLGEAAKRVPDCAATHQNMAALLAADGRVLEAADCICRAAELDPANPEILAMLAEARDMVKKVRPVSSKQKGKKTVGPTQVDINSRLSRINSALSRTARKDNPSQSGISLCMIVKNEEDYLDDCLRSVNGLVSEIVVVNTGSTDRTADIAASHGAMVIRREWTDNFSDARNAAKSHATGEWVLVLDADERLDPASIFVIARAVRSASCDGYELIIRNLSADGGSEGYTHRACRLYRNRPEYSYTGRVHERITPSIAAAGGRTAQLDAVIHHLGYQSQVIRDRGKHERYIRLLLADLEEDPQSVHCLYNLGTAYWSAGDAENAILHLQRAADMVGRGHDYGAQIFCALANALCASGRPEDALAVVERARKLDIKHPELHFCSGNALFLLRRFKDAVKQFTLAIRLGSDSGWTGDTGIAGYKSYYGIASCNAAIGDHKAAVENCLKGISEQPNDVDLHELLSRCYFKLEEFDKAEAELKELVRMKAGDDSAISNLGDFYYGQGRLKKAREQYLRLQTNGSNGAQTHYRLGLVSQGLGEVNTAIESFKLAVSLDSGYVPAHLALGRAHREQDMAAEALECFVKAAEIDQSCADAYFGAGEVVRRLGQHEKAADLYQRGLLSAPQSADGFAGLGTCYLSMGAYDAAIMAYRSALAIRPDHAEARECIQVAQSMMDQRKVA